MTRDTTLQGVILMLAFCVIAPLLDVGAKKLAAPERDPRRPDHRRPLRGADRACCRSSCSCRLSMALSGKALAYAALRALLLIVSTFAFVSGIRVMRSPMRWPSSSSSRSSS